MEEVDSDRPYIEKPKVMDDDSRNGLMCFLNMDRQCGPDCMAYTTFASESPTLNEQQKNCALIVAVERLGRHTGGLLKLAKDTVADASRGKRPPPNPAGQ